MTTSEILAAVGLNYAITIALFVAVMGLAAVAERLVMWWRGRGS